MTCSFGEKISLRGFSSNGYFSTSLAEKVFLIIEERDKEFASAVEKYPLEENPLNDVFSPKEQVMNPFQEE